MSKKRKTRSQKEKTMQRREHQAEIVEKEIKIPAVSYSVKDIATPTNKRVQKESPQEIVRDNHLFKDMRTIGAATGMIIAFDILLFTLLSTGALKLGFLGY